ncbi:MAG: hypothetical protein AABX03_05205 [Nanoarchaeota archaeon]
MEEKKKSRIISVDDIERKNNLLKREEMRTDIAGDINDVIAKVGFGPRNNKVKKKKSLTSRILIPLGIILLLLVIINIILGNIWLLKFFIQDFSKTISSWFG